MNVWVGVLNHNHGTDVYAATTEEAVKADIYRYVQQWWDTEITAEVLPKDHNLAIQRYFERVASESYSITYLPVIGA